jgi:hypothetical protein
MRIRNDSPLGDLDVPLLRRVVERGDEVDVSAEHAVRLLQQDIWTAVDDEARRVQAELDGPEDEVITDDAAN